MAKYPPEVWASLWIKNGGLPSKTREAVATVMCESGGDTDATSPVGARGGWQFMPGTLASEKCARDPDCSTREAVKLSNKGRDFSAWDCNPDSVARSGTSTGDATFKNYMADLKIPFAPDVPLPGPDFGWGDGAGDIIGSGSGAVADLGIPGISDLAKSIQGVNAFFTGLGELILTPEGWLRTGKLVGGSVLIFWGLRILIRESTGTDPVKAATNTVKKGAEVAALAATVK